MFVSASKNPQLLKAMLTGHRGVFVGFAGPFVMGKLSGLKGGYSTAMFVMGSVNLFNALLLFCK